MSIRTALLIRTLIRHTVVLCATGVFIGILHEQDLLVAVVLGIGLLAMLYRKRNWPVADRKWLYTGTLLSAGLGSICEHWGITNQYWQYHDLGPGPSFPFWLPFAWAGAFVFLSSLERRMVQHVGLKRFSAQLVLTSLLAAIFPTLGEIITIQLGVWTYTWGYQVFGVPVLAIFLLMLFHTGVFLLLHVLFRRDRTGELI